MADPPLTTFPQRHVSTSSGGEVEPERLEFMYSVVPRNDVAGGVEMVQEGLDKVCRVHVDINALQGQCFLQRLRAGAHARAPGQEEVCRGKPCHPQRQVPAVGEDVLAGLAGFVKLEDVP